MLILGGKGLRNSQAVKCLAAGDNWGSSSHAIDPPPIGKTEVPRLQLGLHLSEKVLSDLYTTGWRHHTTPKSKQGPPWTAANSTQQTIAPAQQCHAASHFSPARFPLTLLATQDTKASGSGTATS